MPLSTAELDEFITTHLTAKQAINARMQKYKMEVVVALCEMTKEVMSKSPMLARMNPPCIVVGDIHGQFYDLLRMFSLISKDKISEADEDSKVLGALRHKFMFLGDYVDRGRHSLECILLVFALKCRYPEKYHLLRGNHESKGINKEYGFYDEIADRFGEENTEALWNGFNEVFAWMPVAGLIGKKILCMHGGISPHLGKFDDIDNIPRPLSEPSLNNLAMDLLWSDPMENIEGYKFNTVRGVSVFFGTDMVHEVCNRLGIQLILRAHQMMMSGYSAFADRKMITIFTAPRYQNDVPNSGAICTVSESGHIGFKILKPGSGRDNGGVGSDSGSVHFNNETKGAAKRAEKEKKRKKRGKVTQETDNTQQGSSSASLSKTKSNSKK